MNIRNPYICFPLKAQRKKGNYRAIINYWIYLIHNSSVDANIFTKFINSFANFGLISLAFINFHLTLLTYINLY